MNLHVIEEFSAVVIEPDSFTFFLAEKTWRLFSLAGIILRFCKYITLIILVVGNSRQANVGSAGIYSCILSTYLQVG